MKPERKSHADEDMAVPSIQFGWPLASQFGSDFLWAPFRSASKLQLVAHNHATAIARINWKFIDENLAILRKEEDALLDVTGRVLNHLATSGGIVDNAMISESFNELYETAVAGLREFSQAINEAQSQSVEALREHTRAVADAAGQLESDRKAA